MQSTDIPTRFAKRFAANAGAGFIRTVPVASQIGIQDGAASFTDGFPPDCFSAIAAGGEPPFGQDFNGLLNAMSAWEQWVSAGGPVTYNSAFSAAVGGYPKGAQLQSAVTVGLFWVSTAENNTTDPDGGSPANWVAFLPPVAATPAETAAGVDNEKYVTPFDLAQAGFPRVVTASYTENNGYEVWSTGIIICQGYVDVPAATIMTVGLPYAHTAWVNLGGSGGRPAITPSDSAVYATGIIRSGGVPTGFTVANSNGSDGPTRFWWNTRGK